MQLILISGLSGSGKSVALNVLEDNGYYCADNLPAKLLLQYCEFLQQEGYNHAALSVDVRSGEGIRHFPDQFTELRRRGVDARLLFLEAKIDTLVKRYSETRRRHPLSDDHRTLQECIQLERELLAGISGDAHRVDTSELHPNALRAWVKEFVQLDEARLTLLFQSFAFKHGLPLDADMVFDVRCLPNPHYDPQLRTLNGKDEPVIRFLAAEPMVQAMYADIEQYIDRWLPNFTQDNRAYLTVAIGCTGGQHRSVYFTERLAARFRHDQQVLVRHRELKGAAPN